MEVVNIRLVNEPSWYSKEPLDNPDKIARFMVDEGKIAMRPAVELSYLPKKEQEALFDTIKMEDCTPSHAQAIKMRKFSDDKRLNEDVIFSIVSEEKGNQKEQFKMPKDRISKYFSPGTSKKQIEETIIKALEMYRKRERSRER